ncbi:thioesterase II family protein [Streptomyces caatingaensis]|uniref:Thioesterase domain-containing protein n=1 Tax=Streptomyces caatingaensis TaxID=1678637 RepID=A0A0K9X9A8_9ACTN|nr:alpha/beta fold hydrolase [Streptomyces caatingaensis]KNB49788.1 hypothetical protein AC230_23750 [Streptomyces caatingaensis]
MTWIKRLPGDAVPRRQLVCFPHAGGTASFYRPWRAALPPDVELLVVQYPGREDRLTEPFAESMDELVAGVSAELPAELDLPFRFFGHSMGALVAYETTRQWERMGLPEPGHLVVSAQYAPDALPAGDIHLGTDDDVLAEAERLGGTGPEVRRTPELASLVAALVRADYQVLETYRPSDGEPVGVPLTALGAKDDPEVRPEDVAGWSAFTTGAFALRLFPGGHFYLRDDPRGPLSALSSPSPSSPSSSLSDTAEPATEERHVRS